MQIQEKPAPISNQSFWETFTAAPHRMMFFAGAVQLVLPIFFWSLELIGRYTELWAPLDILIPATWAHGFVMTYGVFIFFIFGFLMTVYPRWMNGELVPRESYISTFLWMVIGMLTFEFGIFFNLTIAATGITIFLFGWAIGEWSLFKVYRTAPAQNKNYETILNFALTAGWLSAASFLLWIITDNWVFQQFSIKAGIWIFLLPILFTVGHRMIPFFSSSVLSGYEIYQPRWTLQVMIAACITHASLDALELPQWLFIADLPLAAVALLHTFKWQFKRCFKDKLLAVLHMAFLWLGIGMTLFTVQSLYLLITGELILGKGPLHAISIGFFTSLLIAMASRVSLGHSGRMLILDNIAWAMFLGLQLVAAFRILADINAINSLSGFSFNLLAILAWLVCIATWVIRFGPFYLTVRADGRPG
jgi:uncharacterized protein involved in response to NO